MDYLSVGTMSSLSLYPLGPARGTVSRNINIQVDGRVGGWVDRGMSEWMGVKEEWKDGLNLSTSVIHTLKHTTAV